VTGPAPHSSPHPRLSGVIGAISSALLGVRVLIVEDEFLVALQLEDDLKSAGAETVGPYGDLVSATAAAKREDFDVAVLDINLNGRLVYPLADELTARETPFVFVSGYGLSNLPERFRSAPRMAKPYDLAGLIGEIRRLSGR